MSINKPRYTVSNSQSSDGGIMVDANGDQAASVYSRTDSFREAVADAVHLSWILEQPTGAIGIHDQTTGRWLYLDDSSLEMGVAELYCIENGEMKTHPTTFRIADLIPAAK